MVYLFIFRTKRPGIGSCYMRNNALSRDTFLYVFTLMLQEVELS